jgi:PAS domain-containing protein
MMKSDEPLVVARNFAELLNMPAFLVDTDGALLYYNKAAEKILGRTFAETGPMSASVWSRIFIPTDEVGAPLLPETLPLVVAMIEQRPATRTMWISGIDNARRHIEVVAFPILGSTGENLGSMALFWELRETGS